MPSLALLPFNMLDGLQKAGIDLAELALRVGLGLQDLKKPMTERQADDFFVAAYERVGNPAAGLALGLQPMRAELFGVVGFSAMTCRNFGEALGRIARYNALVSACQIDIRPDAHEAEIRICYGGPTRPYSRCRLDIQMGTLLSFGRTFTEQPIVPLRVTLTDTPAYHARYAGAFGCPVVFDHAHDAIVFDAGDLALPLISANPHVGALFEDAAERDLQAHASQRGAMTQAVRDALQNLLRGDVPSIESVARALHLSERTLQRRLADEGERFAALLDEARRDLAQRYLSAGRASLTEIAYLLGFADPTSFFRSFKRWTGTTPADFRQGGAITPIVVKDGKRASAPAPTPPALSGGVPLPS